MRYAILASAYLINTTPSIVLSFELKNCFLTSHFIYDLSLKVFSGSAFVHVHSHNRNKPESRALKCIFIRYSPT